jgi:hypothetical protein
MIKYYKVVLDGIDKTGKDKIREYVRSLSRGRYTCSARGIMSLLAYSKLYERNYKYDLSNEKNTINVLLDVQKEDWEIRCKLTQEPLINFEQNRMAFQYSREELLKNELIVLEYNTTLYTPYYIALDIIKKMDKLNENEEGK